MSQASSSKICKYDVFLSFRGKDTRRNFVSHLYNALEQRGIHAFKDDERLEKGKSVSDELLKAIEEARFAVVIFSKRYASSRWCLEELAHIIKCKNELEQIAIPVFYDVSPSDVCYQNPPFAKSFSKHEKKYKDDMDKVQRWRDAFAYAGKLAGYHLQNYKDEGECIKKVVDEISSKSLHVISPFSESSVGIQSRTEKVISLLDIESNDHVHSVGIWGMSGIGKTEIASAINGEYRHKFDAGCFLDVGAMYLKKGITWLQQALIRDLLGIKKTITSEHEGAAFISSRLRWKKVLIILDDVNHLNQLKFLVGGLEWFGRGSRILITTVDKQLLTTHVKEDKVYEVPLLSEHESLQLFRKHAFGRESPDRDLEKLSYEVVKYADGLPLALIVLGSSLLGRKKDLWVDIIDRLKKIPNRDILKKLRIGLDGLDKDEMRIFLDIACLYNHRSIFYVEPILKSCGIHHLIGISRLIEKSLLSIKCGRITMHNLIREMGENVLREEFANSRIWLPEEVHKLFVGELETKKVESLLIPKGYSFDEDDHVNYSKVFEGMQSLEVLIVDDETICSESTVTSCLPSNLRWIEWPNYPSSSLPERLEPSNLVGLVLFRSRIVQLWPISKKLSNLKHLDLRESLGLTKTPNFADMPNLETLHLRKCENLEEVRPSLGHCRRLTYLDLDGCEKLKKLPKFVCMKSLETLNLKNCTSLEEFPEICGDMRRLSRLYVGSPWIRSLPSSLSGLRELELRDCELIESIPDTIQNLEYLYISGCNKLTMLPTSLFESQQLKDLKISHCSRLVELPISLGVQKKLWWLKIEGSENLKKLPSSIQMESLQFLEIHNCPKLDTFPEIKGDMHHLKRLTLDSTGIRELPSSIGNLRGLHILGLSGCEDLVSLPDCLCNLKNLQHLYLRGCKKLEKLPENIGDLNIQLCQNRNELPGELAPNLLELHADYHLALKSIRDLVNKCLKLCKLSISLGAHEKSECETVSSEQVNVFLQHFLRTYIQCDFHQRDYFLISFPKVRIPELFDYQFINRERIPINLNPSWYTDKFMGFSICCSFSLGIKATLVCKSDPERKHSLHYRIPARRCATPVLYCIYIPFETMWRASGNKEGKNPNDYYLFEVSNWSWNKLCWGIRLEYQNKVRRWRRKQRAAQSPDRFSVSRKDDAVRTEIGCSLGLPEPSLASTSWVFTEHNIATDRGLPLGNENKDQAATAVQKEHKSQNVELINVCGSPSRKMDDSSRKRKRKRNRKKKRKIARTDETSLHDSDGS